MEDEDEKLAALVTAVTQSPKYRHITPDLIRQVGARELANRRTLKEAVKATKNKLHQVGGAYRSRAIDFEQELAQLDGVLGEETAVREWCLGLMRRHASTQERLPILADFYGQTLTGLTDVRRVLDLACGLNPLARPWMPLSASVEYVASDIYADSVAFLGAFMAKVGLNGRVEVRDLITNPPVEQADLILLLKTLPVLEQIEKGAASRLLDVVNGRYLLITFPVRSLGGRQKGMAQNYEAMFRGWVDGRDWHIRRFEFTAELAFLVTTKID
ncbi:MAG: hypothetical protein Kow0080_32000 [Candidatus Promineifilaceae bacterium]